MFLSSFFYVGASEECAATCREETNLHAGMFELEPIRSWFHINDAHSDVLAFNFTATLTVLIKDNIDY